MGGWYQRCDQAGFGGMLGGYGGREGTLINLLSVEELLAWQPRGKVIKLGEGIRAQGQ